MFLGCTRNTHGVSHSVSHWFLLYPPPYYLTVIVYCVSSAVLQPNWYYLRSAPILDCSVNCARILAWVSIMFFKRLGLDLDLRGLNKTKSKHYLCTALEWKKSDRKGTLLISDLFGKGHSWCWIFLMILMQMTKKLCTNSLANTLFYLPLSSQQ